MNVRQDGGDQYEESKDCRSRELDEDGPGTSTTKATSHMLRPFEARYLDDSRAPPPPARAAGYALVYDDGDEHSIRNAGPEFRTEATEGQKCHEITPRVR